MGRKPTNILSNWWRKNNSYDCVEKNLDALIQKSNKLLDMFKQIENVELNVEKKYLICDEKHFNYPRYGYEFDPDSSPVAWKYYDIVYNGFIKICPDAIMQRSCSKGYSRLIGVFDFSKSYLQQINNVNLQNGIIKIGGDCVFNFNSTQSKKYENIINDDQKLNSNQKQVMLNKLKLCSYMHHSPYNFSLMPTTGGLNLFKKSKCAERADKFSYKISDYYETKSEEHIIFSYVAGKKELNKACLKIFLDKETYLKKIFIFDDKSYMNRLINNAQNDIDEGERVNEYMDIAIEYWKSRLDIFKHNKEGELL